MGRRRLFTRVIELSDGSLQRTRRKSEGRESHGLSYNESNKQYYSLDDRRGNRIYHGTDGAYAVHRPESMTLHLLPPYSKELMPMERVWQWLRRHDLSNRIFENEAAIDQARKESWNKFTPKRQETVCATSWIERTN